MTFTFRPAARENVGLLIALAGASGSGKTYSAMRLAAGIVGPGKRFAVVDTEARRALHYADRFAFDHCELKAPFRPDSYAEAVRAADTYAAIVIDSASHEWSGEGGVLDWQEQELERMAGQDWAKRERVKLSAWIKPKMAHKAMVQRLLQSRAHVIFCLRAEEKVEMVRGDDGKTKIVPKGYQPTCAKDFMFEMTASFLLLPDAPGIGKPIKLQEQHRALFPASEQIGEDAGKRLAEWARGGSADAARPGRPDPSETPAGHAPAGSAASAEPPTDWPKWGREITVWVSGASLAQLETLPQKRAAKLAGYKAWDEGKWSDLMALVAARKSELMNV